MPTAPQTTPTEAAPGHRDIRALILDDSAFDRKRIRRLGAGMGKGFQLQEAPSLKALAHRLDETAFDLVMIDYRLPEGDGFAALDLVQRHAAQGNAATIMISGEAQASLAVAAMKQGCNDFMVKQDLTPERFRQAVLAALTASRWPGDAAERALTSGAGAADPGAALAAALGDPRVRAALLPAIKEGLREALDAAPHLNGWRSAGDHTADAEAFIAAFLATDEFLFRQ